MSSSSAQSTTARRGLRRMKHIQLRLLGVQDWVQQRLLTVGKVTSDETRSDILTEPMLFQRHCEFGRRMGLRGLPFRCCMRLWSSSRRFWCNHWRWKQTYPTRATSPTKAPSTVWRPWRTQWCFYRMAILSLFHDAFVFIFVITMATTQRFVVNVELGLVGIFILERTMIFLSSQNESFFLSLAGNLFNLLAIDGRCKHTVRARVFLMLILPACLSQPQSRALNSTHTLKEHIVFVLFQNSHASSRNVIRRTSLEHCTYTGRVHSFLIFDTIFFTSTCQPASTLRRSTTTSEWRFGWASILHRLWAQTACWTQGSQAFHRRQSGSCWTRGIACQTPYLPPTEHGVDLRFCWEHRDTASGIGLGRRANSCTEGCHNCTYRSEKTMRNDHKFITLHEKLDVQFISRSGTHRETCRVVFKQKQVASRNVFPWRRFFLWDINRFLGAINLSLDSLIR